MKNIESVVAIRVTKEEAGQLASALEAEIKAVELVEDGPYLDSLKELHHRLTAALDSTARWA